MIKRHGKNIKIFFNYILGPLIFIILTYILITKINDQPDLPQRWHQIKASFRDPLFWLAVLLMPINWGLEAAKWNLLINKVENFSFKKSFKSVLAGCSITMLTPNRIGEYGGRILYVREESRLPAVALNMIGSLSQLFVTLLFGTIGLYLLLYLLPAGNIVSGLVPYTASIAILVCCTLAACFMLLFYLRVGWLVKWILRKRYFKKYVKYFHYVHEFERKDLLRILGLSILRYISFILQYLLLLHVLGVEIPLVLCFWLLTVFYLVMTIAPTIGFTELPLRAAASVEILHLFSSNVLGIQAASLAIWIVNLVIPAIAGSLFIFGLKIIKER